ncbi:MAG: hypothetical protein WA981_04145 [Glaciecola sp.]
MRYAFSLRLWMLLIASAFTVSCANDKRPEAYVNPISVVQHFPQHASTLSKHQSLLSALKQRNLVIDKSGTVLPITESTCGTNLYYRITGPNLPSVIGEHQDLLSGFYIDVAYRQQWQVVDTDYHFSTQNDGFNLSLLLSALLPVINNNEHLVVRTPAKTNPQKLLELASIMSRNLPAANISMVVDTEASVLLAKYNINSVLNQPTAHKDYLGEQLLTSKAKHRVLMRGKPAKISGLVADANILKACMETTNVVTPAKAMPSPNMSMTDVVLALPSNANFNALSRQVNLLSQGEYMHINGDILQYSTYQRLQNNDKCATLKVNDPLYKYCVDRKQDGQTTFTSKAIIMRKQAN